MLISTVCRTVASVLFVLGLPLFARAQWHPWTPKPQPKDTFHSYNICFPADIILHDCAPPPPPQILKDELGECDMLAVHIKENSYKVSGDGCVKIFRTYSVINWCAYKEACGPQDKQVFVVDRNAPDFDGVLGKGVCLLVRDENKDKQPEVYYSRDLIADPSERIAFPQTCLPNAHPVWQYTQMIIIHDKQPPVVTADTPGVFLANPANCLASVRLNFRVTDNCTGPIALARVELASGKGGMLRDPSAFIPNWKRQTEVRALGGNRYEARLDSLGEGTYELGVVFRDDCGNLSQVVRIPFEVRDSSPPVPICYHGLSASLMPAGAGAGMVVLRAQDFAASPIYDCSGQGPQVSPFNSRQTLIRHYSLNFVGDAPNRLQDSLIFDCRHVGQQVPVEVHAWDTRGNHAFCRTYVKIQDNGKHCAPPQPSGMQIAGVVRTEMGMPMGGVEVYLSGTGIEAMAITDAQGRFVFEGLTPGMEYMLKPVYSGDIMQGLDARDLAVLQQHILGIAPLESAFQRIAADVNNSGYISVADMVLLQRLILGRVTDYSNILNWRFVSGTFDFPDPNDPWMTPFPEYIRIPALGEKDTNLEFVAIKTGDLDHSAMMPAAVLRQAGGGRMLEIEDRLLQPGLPYAVPLRLKGDWSEALALSLRLDIPAEALRVLDLLPGQFSEEQYVMERTGALLATGVLPGQLTGSPLLTLVLETERPALLSELLALDSRFRHTTHLRSGVDEGLQLQFSSPEKTVHEPDFGVRFAPNPFYGEGVLRFVAPQDGEVTLTLLDAQGRVVRLLQQHAPAGENRWTILASWLPAPGVYQAQIRSDWGTSVIKIMKY